MTAAPDHYYHYQYSPPVSPKSIPHGYKRKASFQDDDIETNGLISHSFKKLRLNNAKRQSASEAPFAVDSIRDADPSKFCLGQQHQHSSRPQSHDASSGQDVHDYMPLDDTTDRIWVNDLDAEIAAIEAEEAKQKLGIHYSDTGNEYAKIPEHLLKHGTSGQLQKSAANMQMVLYKDPISISVPEEDDAVRKTIIAARRRMREKQAEEREREQLPLESVIDSGPGHLLPQDNDEHDEDSMELD